MVAWWGKSPGPLTLDCRVLLLVTVLVVFTLYRVLTTVLGFTVLNVDRAKQGFSGVRNSDS